MSEPPLALASRQWSCASLLRGRSYLLEQQSQNAKMTFDDVLEGRPEAAKGHLHELEKKRSSSAPPTPTPTTKEPTRRVAPTGGARSSNETTFGPAILQHFQFCEVAEPEEERKTGTEDPCVPLADIDDKKSLEKLSAALKRLCCPKKSSGKLEVSPEVHKQRDKYEKDVKEYWVDIKTTGGLENEHSEMLIDSTCGEGDAGSFDLGITDSTSLTQGMPEDEGTDHDLEEVDDNASSKSKGCRRDDCAVDNVGEVMKNLLKTQAKCEMMVQRLEEEKSPEGKRSLDQMQKYCKNMIALHDKLADLKSFFDGEKLQDESKLDSKTLGLKLPNHFRNRPTSRALMEEVKIKKPWP
ncbi:unnamed protein product [Durusdinium trenchii]|uniref:Uncharacterized protein n=1 Tax=Durusdinium trenchii TaxID=1381693 RepID=A0ABP0R1F1_9DINO